MPLKNDHALKTYPCDKMDKLTAILFDESRIPAVLFEVIEGGRDFVVHRVNPAMLDMENLKLPDVLEVSVQRVFPAAKYFGLLDVFEDAWKTNSPKQIPFRIYRDEGTHRYQQYSVHPLREAGLLLVMYEDSGYLKNIINSIYGFIGIYLPDGTLVECNNAPLIAAGITRDDVIGKPFWETFWWAHSEKEQEKIRYALTLAAEGKGVRDEYTVNTASGDIIIIDAQFSPLDWRDGRVERLIGFGVDITGKKRIADKLMSRDFLLKEAERAAMLDFWQFCIKTGEVEFHNEASTYNQLGIASLHDFALHIHDEDRERVMTNIREAIEGVRSQFEHVYRFKKHNGKYHHIHTQARTMSDALGKPANLIGVSVDITNQSRRDGKIEGSFEKSELAALIKQLQYMTEKRRGEMAREIHDQISQNLTHIKMHLVSIVTRDGADPKTIKEQLTEAIKEVDLTINQTRLISKSLRNPLLDDVGLGAAIASEVKAYMDQYDIDISLKLDLGSIYLSNDRKTALFRVFQESLNNAIKHSKASCIRVELGIQGTDVRLIIADDGIGFDMQGKSWDSMTGLLGMRERAHCFDGEFRVESVHNSGTTIHVRIPV